MNKSRIILSFLFFTFLNCEKKTDNNKNRLEGEYYYSEDANLSYFFPIGFTLFEANNDSEYDFIVDNLKNSKLKKILIGNYLDRHISPMAKNFQYFYKEDSTNFQNIFINEVKYFRLNDSGASGLSSYNRSYMNSINKDSTVHISLHKDYIINKSDYQIIVNKGDLIKNNDTIFWENYIVSKYYRTFSIQIESNNSEIDFLPYLDNIKFGDKRIEN